VETEDKKKNGVGRAVSREKERKKSVISAEIRMGKNGNGACDPIITRSRNQQTERTKGCQETQQKVNRPTTANLFQKGEGIFIGKGLVAVRYQREAGRTKPTYFDSPTGGLKLMSLKKWSNQSRPSKKRKRSVSVRALRTRNTMDRAPSDLRKETNVLPGSGLFSGSQKGAEKTTGEANKDITRENRPRPKRASTENVSGD